MIHGLTKLSTLLTPTPQISMKMPQPVEPWWNSHKAAGSQIKGGPTGTTERKNVSNASTPAPGTPAIRNPIPAITACTRAVPKMP